VAINTEQKIAKVKCSDKNDPYVVSLIELTLIGPDATADADKTTTAGGDEWDAAPASAFTEGDRVLIHSKPQWGGCYLVQRHGDRWRVEEEKTAAQHDNVPESAMTLAKETESKNAPTPDVDDWDDPVPESKPAAPTAPAPSSSADGWDEPDEAPPPRGETRVRISGKK
jgi:hypothetical protein